MTPKQAGINEIDILLNSLRVKQGWLVATLFSDGRRQRLQTAGSEALAEQRALSALRDDPLAEVTIFDPQGKRSYR